MREILFRGKRLDTGGWVYGYYCKYTKRQVCPVGDELKPEDIAHLIINDAFADWNMPRSLQAYDVDPETVGQYTGLKDKSGNKIFEGDVVSDGWITYTPIFQNGIYMAYNVKHLHLTKQGPSTQFNIIWRDGCEVIGNIYDNPEMLEVS
jgi:uncharacterized phage protein (TIGR01671 family)